MLQNGFFYPIFNPLALPALPLCEEKNLEISVINLEESAFSPPRGKISEKQSSDHTLKYTYSYLLFLQKKIWIILFFQKLLCSKE